MEWHKFNIGDYVRVINHTSKYYGKEGKVSSVYYNAPVGPLSCEVNYCYNIYCSDGFFMRHVYEYELDTVQEENKQMNDKNRCYITSATIGNYISDSISYSHISESFSKWKENHKMPITNISYVPSKIIYNNPATIVFWMDGTKTVVKKAKGEKFNEYTAFCAALAKKIYKNNSQVNKIVKSGIHQKVK